MSYPSTTEPPSPEKLTPIQRAAIQETKNVFPPLRERIKDALQRLQDQVEDGESNGADEAEITKAKEVIESAKEASRS